MKKAFLLCGSFLLLFTFVYFIGISLVHAADNQIPGLHYYPGAKEDPANPAIIAPHMQNVHLLTKDSFEKVLAWYTQKIGKFTDLSSSKGKQATWREEPKEDGYHQHHQRPCRSGGNHYDKGQSEGEVTDLQQDRPAKAKTAGNPL
jgi:hypothetical protein